MQAQVAACVCGPPENKGYTVHACPFLSASSTTKVQDEMDLCMSLDTRLSMRGSAAIILTMGQAADLDPKQSLGPDLVRGSLTRVGGKLIEVY